MSEGGERMCPLCAEEMDLTDQHLKPCKCGYEICVWCWHHIIDMAEKDETEGRCPACRTPYDKEKIVGMTANREKLVSEMNVEKKLKSHKGKSKTSEGRKQLGSVRVIQRNLVYVVGLPLNFADEDLLQRKEYFGQYGKVLKVSISRTATGAIQQFANSTCSVYITYSKEEEAIRCIQSVNGFVLDGRPLRACFGTTKYCHAWLRNMPCSNPDCLYLHEIGSQEDSFTKDEVISAYTRSRVQQITGATNSMQRRPGNVLPPPADEYCNNSPAPSGKLINKTAISTNNSASTNVVSPPNSSSGRSAALPAGASWGTRSSNNHPLSITPCSNGPSKPDAPNGPVTSSAEVTSLIKVSSLQIDTGKKLVPIEEKSISIDKSKPENLVPAKKESKTDCCLRPDSPSTSIHPATSQLNRQPLGVDTTKPEHNLSKIVDSSIKSCGPALDNSVDFSKENIENICADFLSMGIHNKSEQIRIPVTSEASGRSASMTDTTCVTDGLSEISLGIPTRAPQIDFCETEDDFLSFDNQRPKDPEVTASRNHLPDFFNSFHMRKLSSTLLNNADGFTNFGSGAQIVDRRDCLIGSGSNFPVASGGHTCSRRNGLHVNDVEYANLFLCDDKRSLLRRYESDAATSAGNIGENSIISNILSLDFDSLDESLTSPQNLAKLLAETDNLQGSIGVSGSWKIQNSNQSRFSFAREEEPVHEGTQFGLSSDFWEKDFKQGSFGNDITDSNGVYLGNDKLGAGSNFLFSAGTESHVFATSHSHISNNKLSAVSRSQISAPPGFSAPGRTAPPGFSSYERTDQTLGMLSGNHMPDASSFSRNQWQAPPSSNSFSNGDIEFMDPAILEVRHGTLPGGINSPVLDVRPSYSPQLSTYEEARLQSFFQRSLPSRTNQRINELGGGFSSISDAYGVCSRVMEQTPSNSFSPFSQFTLPQPRNSIASNGQWNEWNEGLGGNNLGMAELLRNERLGFKKLYGGYEDSKIGMPSSGHMYNGTYGT